MSLFFLDLLPQFFDSMFFLPQILCIKNFLLDVLNCSFSWYYFHIVPPPNQIWSSPSKENDFFKSIFNSVGVNTILFTFDFFFLNEYCKCTALPHISLRSCFSISMVLAYSTSDIFKKEKKKERNEKSCKQVIMKVLTFVFKKKKMGHEQGGGCVWQGQWKLFT